jgi:protein-S-isoprenylcysteine O-methyltransferase Ste14
MNRPALALVVLAIFFAANFGLRTWLHWRRTGTTGLRGISGNVGSPEWLGGVLFVIGLILGVAAPLAELAGVVGPLLPSRRSWLDDIAWALVFLGIAGTSWAQAAMGASWRIGVKQDERTELVARGPFRWARNPFFSFMLVTAAGLALYLPNPLSIGAFVSLWLAIELQVRFAEEPYLRRTHGEAYDAYCRRVGRFVPGLGRVRRDPAP